MSQILSELKRSCAKLLALMLVFSAITGVLGMSVSADENDDMPTLKQGDPIVTYYDGISNDYRYRYNAFAIAVDDSASVGTQHSLNSVKGINFNAEFENGSAVKGSLTAKNITYYQRAAGSDTFNGGISDVIKENAYTVISNLNSVIITPNVIPKIVSSSLMAKFDLEIVFEDDTVIPVHTIIEKEDGHVNFDNQN
ncbi:MAG: hypothetical protein IIZ46_08355, partial [Clostridia bacterium]|nr:hypothetical protein [Clostridia bacterium]